MWNANTINLLLKCKIFIQMKWDEKWYHIDTQNEINVIIMMTNMYWIVDRCILDWIK